MGCTSDVVRAAAGISESGLPVTVEGVSKAWGRSYGSTQRMVRHAVSLGWLEDGSYAPTPAGLEACGRI